MSEAVGLGVLFGIGAALSVGPIFVTIVHEALTRGFGASVRVIAGSSVGDVVLVLPALLASSLIARVGDLVYVVIGVLGAAYFVWMGVLAARESQRQWRSAASTRTSGTSWSFAKGVLGNLLNPLSWVFWFATGTPTMLRVYRGAGWPGLAVFTVVWFGVAMGVEVLLAASISRTRRAVGARTLAVFQAASAVTFLALAVILLTSRPTTVSS